MTANPSRSAFLTSEWTDFCKETYRSEDKHEQAFRRKWKSGLITGKLNVPFSVGRARTPEASDRIVPDVPSLPQEALRKEKTLPTVQAVQSKPRPY